MTDIRPAAGDEMPQAVAAIVAAFLTDPVGRFVWPSPCDYLRFMPEAVQAFCRASIQHSATWLSDDFCGAAVWLPPGVEPDGESLYQLLSGTAASAHRDDVLATFDEMERSHPDQPHWHLPMVGVEPTSQGRGLGARLMRQALARCDEEGTVAYLESSNPRNISLYLRQGFEVLREIKIGAAPLVTPMLRRPRQG
jgi:ribosomal protein S18 acetylase RimI-like enzyme